MTIIPPKVFVSYSHDSEPHKDWVLKLATRLMANGVDVILDQWDLNLGGDLPRFMETGLVGANRVLAICTSTYVKKANAGLGGVGYEKMILTAQVMQDVTSERIIPIIRDHDAKPAVPTFLVSKVYVDFRDDLAYESKYGELVREILGQKIKPRPPIGTNPFLAAPILAPPIVSFGPERYVSPALSGVVTFDYSNNNGRYVVGAGDLAFETAWSGGSNTAIHTYTDPPSIRTVALAVGIGEISDIVDASAFDSSSRVRSPQLGEIVVWQNTAGYYLATKVTRLKSRGYGDTIDEVEFSYVIQADKSTSFQGTT
jgi:TIR domain